MARRTLCEAMREAGRPFARHGVVYLVVIGTW